MAGGRCTRAPFEVLVGLAAIVAPTLHTSSDLIEWHQGGFSSPQLWLNFAAFVPMTWLLLGIAALHEARVGFIGTVGAIGYGASFTYFAHTTLVALEEGTADYEQLWSQLEPTYTLWGAVMVVAGALFAWSAWNGRWLPRTAVFLFALGLLCNLVLGVLPVPDILQTAGSALRNAGLVWMGVAILRRTGTVAAPTMDPVAP